jgi:hypothetical protein
MEWIVRLECRDKSRVLHARDVARFERQTEDLRPEEVGLSLLGSVLCASTGKPDGGHAGVPRSQ